MAPFVARFGAEFRLAYPLCFRNLREFDLRNPLFRRKRDTQRDPQKRDPRPLWISAEIITVGRASTPTGGFSSALGRQGFKRFVDTCDLGIAPLLRLVSLLEGCRNPLFRR